MEEVADEIRLVGFMDYDLGFFDHEICRLESAGNPPHRKCYPWLRLGPPVEVVVMGGIEPPTCGL